MSCTLSQTRVVNLHGKEGYDVYIGRPSKWGNSFSHLPGTLAKFRVKDRGEAVQKYREWINAPAQAALKARIVPELKDRVLGCFCKPLACHGDVLAEIANASN